MKATEITAENFQQEVMEAGETVLLDFYAQWCGPCRSQAKILEEVEGDWKLCKVDIDQNQSLSDKFHITSVPTLVKMKNGQPIKIEIGLCHREKLLKMMAD